MTSVTTPCQRLSLFFFFNDTATTEIYTLSLHDALPISSTSTTTTRASSSSSERRKRGIPRRLPSVPSRSQQRERSRVAPAGGCPRLPRAGAAPAVRGKPPPTPPPRGGVFGRAGGGAPPRPA